jgi:transposase
MKMLHLEVRKKIIEASKNGIEVKNICAAYGAGKSAVYDLLQQERETGDITPKTHMRGRKPSLSREDLATMEKLLIKEKDITAAEIRERMGLSLCESSVSKIIRNKLGYRYKKRQYMPVNASGLTL